MQPDDRVRIRHMADALNSAIRFCEERRRAHLDQDEMLLFALIQAIQVVGEAASKVTPGTRDRHPHIPWASILGMRHRLVHAYFDINRDILWTTVTEAAPTLLAQIRKLLGQG